MLMSIEEAATESLKRPDYYFTSIFEDENPHWGRAGISQHRDSDVLERSNYQVILKDLEERFEDDVTEIGASHWAVGWVDFIMVRVLIDPDGDVVEDNITDAFKACMEWHDRLADYPVADEFHLSELEWDEKMEDWKNEWPNELIWDDGRYVYGMMDRCGCDDVWNVSKEDLLIEGYYMGIADFEYDEEFWIEFIAERDDLYEHFKSAIALAKRIEEEKHQLVLSDDLREV